jgi:FixJ family two-component response regulator
VIYVVDDDASVRTALQNLFASMGRATTAFESTEAFLRAKRPDVPSCLVLDIRLPGVGGLEFQQDLARRGVHLPIVFITAHGDIPMTARAMKAGAIAFLTKPLQRDELLAAVHEAIEHDRLARAAAQGLAGLRARFAALSSREREVMAFVTAGLGNKEIAAKLGLAEITIKVHRRQVMLKMRADSLAALVRMAAQLEERRDRTSPVEDTGSF